ncbi:hypothetical protein LCGC14_2874610 [marine sediment metagenome]|uniref:Uncharacterized protein n=1 Tax=marine sediment metagenome TaxID=412755 RepID=A0A0F8Y1Y2_9ZZZZ
MADGHPKETEGIFEDDGIEDDADNDFFKHRPHKHKRYPSPKKEK